MTRQLCQGCGVVKDDKGVRYCPYCDNSLIFHYPSGTQCTDCQRIFPSCKCKSGGDCDDCHGGCCS